MNCDPNALMAAAACFKCIPRGELRAAQVSLLKQWAENAGPEPPTPGEQLVEEWVERVVANGGETPSANTQSALSVFADGLIDSGLDTKMKSVNCLVPDNMIACATPLIANVGSPSWAINGFDASHLSVNGLQGVLSTSPVHYFNTGIIPALELNLNSTGITLYIVQTSSNTSIEMAVWQTNAFLQLLGDYDSAHTFYFDCWNQGTGRISANHPSAWTGYVSGNRTAANATAIYIARSDVAHMEKVSDNVTVQTGVRPGAKIYAFCCHEDISVHGPTSPTNKQISFIAIHDGLTQSESAAFYGLIQALRTALGGGFV